MTSKAKSAKPSGRAPQGGSKAPAPAAAPAIGEPTPRELHIAFVEALDRARADPVVLAKAEYLAQNHMVDLMTARANAHGRPPTIIRQVGDASMICYLQSDGSYGQCQPYTGAI